MIKFSIHIILVVSIFFSSGGFWTMNHYCQDKIVGTSFFLYFGSGCNGEAAASCAGEMNCCKGQQEEKDCCHNILSYHQLDQYQQVEKVEFKNFEHLVVLSAIVPPTDIVLPSFDEGIFRHFNYTPPPIVFDRQVWLQTFLC